MLLLGFKNHLKALHKKELHLFSIKTMSDHADFSGKL